MLELLVTVLLLMIFAGVAYWLISMLPLPAPMMQIAQVVIVLICLLVLIGMVFGGVPMPFRTR